MTVTVWPPIVNVPVRGLPVVFCATENVTDPIPAPVPLVMVIQLLVVLAVQVHDVPVMTLSVWVDAEPVTVKVVGVSVYEHCASALDTLAAQINTASPQQRAIVMAAFLEEPRENTPARTRGEPAQGAPEGGVAISRLN